MRSCCREFVLVLFAQLIEHRRQELSTLLSFFLFFGEDHQLVQHDREPLRSLVLRDLHKDLPEKLRHFGLVVDHSKTCLPCRHIDIDRVFGVQQHDISHP